MDAGELVRQVAAAYQAPAEARGVVLTAAVDADLRLDGDPERLERVLRNLRMNRVRPLAAAGDASGTSTRAEVARRAAIEPNLRSMREISLGVSSAPTLEVVGSQTFTNLADNHGMPPRITPVDEATLDDAVRTIFADAERRGAPNATLLRLLARRPSALHAFYDGWHATFYAGEVPHTLKELMRVRMARLRNCGY